MKIKSYEQAQAELEGILEALESNEVSVDDLVKKVERAAELLRYCETKLRTTEEKVNKIMEDLEN